MKKRLNLLCLLILLVLGYSVAESLYQAGVGMSLGVESGFKEGYAAGKEGRKPKMNPNAILNMKPVALVPNSYPLFADSVMNEKTGEYVPALYSQMLVSVKTKTSPGQTLALILFSIIHLFAALAAVVIFIFLIVSINKSRIFIWKNVYRLRWLGGVLILSFISTLIPICVTNYELADAFALRGYSLNLSELVTITNLVLGLSALVVGEVFAIGLRMKEEQELTI